MSASVPRLAVGAERTNLLQHNESLAPPRGEDFADTTMKLIVAVIQPTKVSAVRTALENLGVTRMTVADAMGYARQRGHIETFRGHEYQTLLLRKVAVEITVNEDFVERTVACLEEHARTSAEGHIGDGKVFVLPVEEVIQISDGQRGPGAV